MSILVLTQLWPTTSRLTTGHLRFRALRYTPGLSFQHDQTIGGDQSSDTTKAIGAGRHRGIG